MKKSISIMAISALCLITTASAIEQCDTWFKKNDFGIAGTMGKSGAGVVLNAKGELDKIFASGYAFYQFDNAEDMSDALSEAALVAKSNIAKYMKEDISSEESIEKITAKKIALTKQGTQASATATKKTVKTQTMSIKSQSKALLTGVIKVCESNDAKKKEIQIVLALSPKTAAAATKVSNTINQELGNRKSVSEYTAERIVGEMDTETAISASSTAKANMPDKVSAPEDSSFSNKAKNMKF